jgi:cytidylate kinase
MAVITISRQQGSLGDEIAVAVARKLNYDCIDKQRIGEALAGHGLQKPEIEKFDEKKPSFWQSFSYHSEKFLHLLKAVIYDFAGKDNAVIVGRGTQVLLKDLPGALHVRIIAPVEIRIRRLVEQGEYDESVAEQILQRSDRDSAGFIGSYFGIDWDDRDLYDLAINTKTISVDSATGLIIEAIEAREFMQRSEEAAEKLSDLALTQKVEAAIMNIPGLAWADLYVEKGIVNLTGTANSADTIEGCKRIVSKVKGVKGLNSQLIVRQDARATPYI